VLVSAIDGATVAGGVISWAQAAPAVGDNVLVLDRRCWRGGFAPISAILRPISPSSTGVRRRWRFCYARSGYRC
jgi:hypothetical protein